MANRVGVVLVDDTLDLFGRFDVAAAGGWKTPETMKLAYQHADAETMVTVVTEPRRLREAR